VDFSTIIGIIDQLVAGGPKGFIIFLVIIIVCLLFDRNRLLKEINTKNARIDEIVDSYYKGNLTLAEALNSLKNVLYELKGQIND